MTDKKTTRQQEIFDTNKAIEYMINNTGDKGIHEPLLIYIITKKFPVTILFVQKRINLLVDANLVECGKDRMLKKTNKGEQYD